MLKLDDCKLIGVELSDRDDQRVLVLRLKQDQGAEISMELEVSDDFELDPDADLGDIMEKLGKADDPGGTNYDPRSRNRGIERAVVQEYQKR